MAELQITRREVFVGAAALVGAMALPAAARPQVGAIQVMQTGLNHVEATQLLAHMRKAEGCLSVRVLQDERGEIALWQEWQSAAQRDVFAQWDPQSPRFQRLEL